MKNIYAGVVCHDCFGILERCQQEAVKSIVCHVVVLDFPGTAFIVHIVGRVGHDQIRLAVVHECSEGFCLGTVAADQSVPTECPKVAQPRDRRLLQLCVHIEIVVFYFILDRCFEQVVKLGGVKACERHIEVRALQIRNKQRQLILVPIAGYFVERDIQRLFFILRQLDHDAVHLGDAHINEYLQALMPANDAPRGLVPDDRLDVTELFNGALQLIVFRISGL